MVAPLKLRGAEELRSLSRRVRRLYALERITRDDFNFVIKRLNEIEGRIQTMAEFDGEGVEVEIPDG
jgi:hypothetical protein